MPDAIELHALVHNARESLGVEIKAWLDPTQPDGIAKIVKCAFAMRNYGGGHMLIGLDNLTGQSLSEGCPADVRAVFHTDVIQPLVAKYASKRFEVTVEFVESAGRLHPVIGIPGGTQVPVATRSGLKDASGNWLLRENRVYVRSLDANGSPSSTEALWSDWEQIMNTCFDNREADIGRFVRRHLSGLTAASLRAAASLMESATSEPPASVSVLPSSETIPAAAASKDAGDVQLMIASPNETRVQVIAELDAGRRRFGIVRKERGIELPEHGAWETAAIVRGKLPKMRPTSEFLARFLGRNPGLTGWPIWFDSRNFTEVDYRPYVFDGAWESYVPDFRDSMFPNIDFWRISPPGKFYHYRALVDDIPGEKRPSKPLTELDYTTPMWRTAEAIAVALEYAKALGATSDANALAIGFRWSRLRGRVLSTWASRNYMLSLDRRAHQDEVLSFIHVPIDAPSSRIAEYVREATAPLYEVFEGFEAPLKAIESETSRVLERRW